MIPGSLARRYARALLQLADTPIQREIFGRDLASFVRAIDTEEPGRASLQAVLASDAFTPVERHAVLQKVMERMSLDATVIKFISFVFERGRISGVSQIARHYAEMSDAMAGRVHAKLTSARPLQSDAIHKVKAALERATGKTILLESAVDPELIGGVVTQVGSVVFDGSLKTQLGTIRNNLRS